MGLLYLFYNTINKCVSTMKEDILELGVSSSIVPLYHFRAALDCVLLVRNSCHKENL